MNPPVPGTHGSAMGTTCAHGGVVPALHDNIQEHHQLYPPVHMYDHYFDELLSNFRNARDFAIEFVSFGGAQWPSLPRRGQV